MRAFACCLLLAGCDWTFPSQRGWLPLVGDGAIGGPSIAHYPGDSPKYYRAADGAVWSLGNAPIDPAHDFGEFVARRFSIPSTSRAFPGGGDLSSDGVVLSDYVAPNQRLLRLVSLTDAPDLLTVEDLFVNGDRGPGYYYYVEYGGTHAGVELTFARDDGEVDVVPGTTLVCPGVPVGTSMFSLTTFDHDAPPCDPRYVAVIESGGLTSTFLNGYDLATHTLHRGLIPAEESFNGEPRFDRRREVVWRCDEYLHALVVAKLETGESHQLPIDCVQLWVNDGRSTLVQDAAGGVWTAEPDGTYTRIATLPPYTIQAGSGPSFVYTRPDAPTYPGDAFDGWVGDLHVVHGGSAPRFSADGGTLYWLEQSASNGGVGDLESFDLVTQQVRPLVHNVKQYDFLPDGRIVAVADAAVAGAWQRAVVVDERRGETRLLAENIDHFVVIGPSAIVTSRELPPVDTLVTP
jgi:hypothetical protein